MGGLQILWPDLRVAEGRVLRKKLHSHRLIPVVHAAG
jgi:hypothetical protein